MTIHLFRSINDGSLISTPSLSLLTPPYNTTTPNTFVPIPDFGVQPASCACRTIPHIPLAGNRGSAAGHPRECAYTTYDPTLYFPTVDTTHNFCAHFFYFFSLFFLTCTSLYSCSLSFLETFCFSSSLLISIFEESWWHIRNLPTTYRQKVTSKNKNASINKRGAFFPFLTPPHPPLQSPLLPSATCRSPGGPPSSHS